ncbi:BRCT domain-containing protein [Paludisphaera soli]|uniref:BRCT domain-containing protein n=1 Tax=Paludisphaera soli TaxID=2712865 RepID=UPI001F0D73D1|nr:BRCT domain-containing protein [Paludisphaera soli]
MDAPIRLEDVRRAWEARDPETVALVVDLARQSDPEPETPLRDGAPTFASYLAEVRSREFRRKPPEEQASERRSRLRALESPDAEVPPPDRLKLHAVLEELWADGGPVARSWFLRIVAEIPARYGAWKAIKRIFKEAEARGDAEVFAALAARFDELQAGEGGEVGRGTLAYLRRRGWRALRRAAERLPSSYADLACDLLARYGEDARWPQTWIANHIFFHEAGGYGRDGFRRSPAVHSGDLLKHRAYPDLWRRTPRPLFGLLERARSDRVRKFAAEALKADFRASLREVEPSWVARLVGVRSGPVDAFVVWVLSNVPRFEQSAFRALGLHEAVLTLFDSPSDEARAYAAGYARTHARDLPVDELIRLADNDHAAVRRLAADLLGDRDPRGEVGLEAWGRLLNTEHGSKLAADVIRKHFGAKELTPDWFRAHLFTENPEAFEFLKGSLARIHPTEKLGAAFFRDLIGALKGVDDDASQMVAPFALGELARFDLDAMPPDFLRRLLVDPTTRVQAARWVDQGKLKAPSVGIDFLKALAYEPDFAAHPWIEEFRRTGPDWARNLAFDQRLADRVLVWLADVRKVPPADIGFDWLMTLVARSEAGYHEFAVGVLSKGYVPADFATREAAGGPAPAAGPVDLKGASFLFTGKMATLKRKDAEDQVKASGGTVSGGVTAKLHYLVIGDDGSPLYGHGKKGDKQTKAESLNASGANIKIISETAFLKMLAAGVQEVSADATLAGCERLWEMATAPGPADAPKARFAIEYLLRHHPDVALAKTERPVDPGAEIPAEFLAFARVEPLFYETRRPLRDFALELARWEFARWAPPSEALVRLAESPHADVRRFVADALLADGSPENRRFRIDPEGLSPEAAYAFCESADASTRELGMQLVGRSPRLRAPEELFRLTESPDRRMRAFAIRALWSLYRDRGTTAGWKPAPPPAPTIGAGARKAATAAAEARGTGAPARPDRLPAEPKGMWLMLRRSLFELPPPRPEKGDAAGGAEKLRPLPAGQAKLALMEVMRDLAVEDVAFARGALPLMEEFLPSRGRSERSACLVAVTRIRHAWPELRREIEGESP